jgi:ribonuclease HII
MHDSIRGVMKDKEKEYLLLVDGNDFKPYIRYENELFIPIDHQCIEGGDNKYCSIAAASILAKTERDKYIEKLCDENPELKEKYGIHKNKGYGTREHLMGISNHGITEWHRKTYGVCKFYT